jgi:hypothetical protein
MNRNLQIVTAAALIITLMLSFAGNVYLWNSLSSKTKQNVTLMDRLSETNKKLSETSGELSAKSRELSATKSELTETQENLETIAGELETMVYEVGELNSKYTEAEAVVKQVMCRTTIPTTDVKYAVTNQDLKDPITYVSGKYYYNNSTSTKFETLWNNSKSSIFTITWPDKTTSKVLVSWNKYDVMAIINANDGCFFYIE